ncbi:MAG TPA: SDR family NAD(P)-dependent oxidoreductase [Thermoleophilaceae bacterium]|nr:SDR family NAD(P)-dependent oxidoreductase [Thermoleophilaceae bacterium]
MKACVTGATGFIGGHVARAAVERGDEVSVTYRDKARLGRLGDLDVRPVRADVLDRGAFRRALKGADILFHSAGYVASRPVSRVFEVNVLGARAAVEAAAAADVGRVVLTSSVGGVGPVAGDGIGEEGDLYRSGALGLVYVDAKHEGEAEALGAAARLGVEVVIVNPAYVLGVPVDPAHPGETSTRTIAHYLRGRLPAVVDGATNIVDVLDVANGHMLAAEKGRPGERYILGGHNIRWADFVDRIAELSGISHPVAILPSEVAAVAGAARAAGLPAVFNPQAFALMAQNWMYSSKKAERVLGYRARPLDETLRTTIDWCLGLIEHGAFGGRRLSTMSFASAGMRAGARVGLVQAMRVAEGRTGRRLVAGA